MDFYTIVVSRKAMQRVRHSTYKPLEVLGPEHELSIVDAEMKALPISDKVIKDYGGKIVNFVELPGFTFGKELQLHVMELKANNPFKSPVQFEETMQKGVETLNNFLSEKFHASLLGTGMHPLLRLEETGIWSHRHRKIYDAMGKIFNLKQHGWLNIQSFHLNLPYGTEENGVAMHNLLANLCAYLPALAASSPIFEGTGGSSVDNRLCFYRVNQREVPTITGDVVPEYVSSFEMYKDKVIGQYSRDLTKAGADSSLLFKEWVNSRGVIFRFDRKALEVRVMDEQECIKSDVALSCYVRAALRGLLACKQELLPHALLVGDFNTIVAKGLDARVQHPQGPTARQVCRHFYDVAWANAEEEEKKFLPLVKSRIDNGSLSEIIRAHVIRKAQRTDFKEATASVYSTLIKCLAANQPYF
jgi:gamma-glutamyl:cysteine ligase YbdK (ATP-grasp superfamily)